MPDDGEMMGRPEAAVVPATEVRVVHSMNTDSHCRISVALPYHYDDDIEQVWPVICVLDANLYFGLVVEMVRAMNTCDVRALHTFRDPQVFHRCVIASSGPNFDDEAAFARNNDRLPVRLHLGGSRTPKWLTIQDGRPVRQQSSGDSGRPNRPRIFQSMTLLIRRKSRSLFGGLLANAERRFDLIQAGTC